MAQVSSVPSGTPTPATAVPPASPQDASGKDTPAPPPLPGKADLGVTYQCNPLDSLVPLKVKEKIWKKEFIELSTLPRDEGKATSLEVEDKEEGPQFQFVHKSNKEITTHRRWKKAFLVFISAHTRKFPEELPGLLIHMNTVNKLAWEQQDWLSYDTDFCTLVTNSAAHYRQLNLQLISDISGAEKPRETRLLYLQRPPSGGRRTTSKNSDLVRGIGQVP